jgi:hypothetical protein
VWIAERRVVGTIKRHFAEKAAAVKIDLLEKVPMIGVITDAHKQLLAGALEQVRHCFLGGDRGSGKPTGWSQLHAIQLGEPNCPVHSNRCGTAFGGKGTCESGILLAGDRYTRFS